MALRPTVLPALPFTLLHAHFQGSRARKPGTGLPGCLGKSERTDQGLGAGALDTTRTWSLRFLLALSGLLWALSFFFFLEVGLVLPGLQIISDSLPMTVSVLVSETVMVGLVAVRAHVVALHDSQVSLGGSVVAVTAEPSDSPPVPSPTAPSCSASGWASGAHTGDLNTAAPAQGRVHHCGPHSDLVPVRRRWDVASS